MRIWESIREELVKLAKSGRENKRVLREKFLKKFSKFYFNKLKIGHNPTLHAPVTCIEHVPREPKLDMERCSTKYRTLIGEGNNLGESDSALFLYF